MARFRERFEVKNEMRDGGKIRPDDNDKTGGKSSRQTQEDIQKEINSVGFDDWEDINDEVDIDDNEQEQNGNTIDLDEKEEEAPQITNLDIEQELEKYYDDSVDIVTLKAYLKEKIPQVYGDRLEKLGIDIDKYLEDHKQSLEYFEGAESYKEMAADLDSYLGLLEEAKDVDKEKVIVDNKETEQLETELDEKEERRILKNEVRDVGEEEIYEQGGDKETEQLETELDEKEERRILKNEVRDVGEEEIYEQSGDKETEQLETELDEKEERRTLKNEVRDVGEEEIYKQGGNKETGFVLKSVNGRDVLSSAIEATESMTRNSTVVEQAKTINIVQKERSEVAKDTQII